MAKREVERTVQRSLIDRLIDRNPGTSADPQIGWSQSVREYEESVRRDLEWLLNTRRIVEPAPEGFSELNRSLYHYGLPDVTSLSADATETPQRLMRQIQDSIELFEPRLSGVRVSPVESEEKDSRQIRFRVEALLEMEPAPERVVFDTILDVSSCKFRIK